MLRPSPPGEGGFWATLALLMPVVLLANVVALVWWAVRRKWIVLLMPLVALVLNLGYISAMVQLPDFKDSGDPHDIRIATLNVNGFRRLGSMPATARAIAGMVNREQVDVLCLQETKAQPEQIPSEAFERMGYRCHYFSAVKKGYSGVAILTLREPDRVVPGMGIERYDRRGPLSESRLRRPVGGQRLSSFGHVGRRAAGIQDALARRFL